MRGLLVRVGIDGTYGGWNAPMNPHTGVFAYVPITEEGEKEVYPGYERGYAEFVAPCRNLGVALPTGLLVPDKLAHLDPDFSNLTYGDEHTRGKPLWELEKGDILAFYASLRPTQTCQHRLVYAIIGLYVVDKVVAAKDIPMEDWDRNAHTRRQPDETDVVVVGRPTVSGRLERCLPIGEFRNKAYRGTNGLLGAWGGLGVNDGWIQRSGTLPHFCDTRSFYNWFIQQRIPLIAKNN